MNLLNRLQVPTIVGALFIFVVLSSCEEDLTTIGKDVIGGEPFTTGKEVYDVFAVNKKVNAVQTNKLAVYQLGNFNDPIYGKTKASITSQIQLSATNPSFGIYSQATEDAADSDDSISTIPENETVKKVYLYIPYLTNSLTPDADGDGVADEFDVDSTTVDSDSDSDGVSDIDERSAGTDPLDASSIDADNDGVNDTGSKDDIIANNFAKRVDLDSIYGSAEIFKLSIKRSTYFLRDLDPSTDFKDAEEYYSTQEFNTSFTSDVLADTDVEISEYEILIPGEDDESTEDEDESKTFAKLNPGIRIELDGDFFQNYILNKEGSSELISQSNFKEYIRGLHLSLEGDEDVMLLLDLTRANITMTYAYSKYNTNSTTDDTSDDTTDIIEKDFTFSFIGTNFAANAVNTFVNEDYPAEITAAIAETTNAEKLYLKGGAGVYAEINLFDALNGLSQIHAIDDENWIINEANLVFYVAQSTNDIKPPRLYLYNTANNLPLYNSINEYSLSDTSYGVFQNYDAILDVTSSVNKYTIRITDHINNMVVRDSLNATLGLLISPDIRITSAINAVVEDDNTDLPAAAIISPLGTVLYGSNVSDENLDKKLKLEIYYTKTN